VAALAELSGQRAWAAANDASSGKPENEVLAASTRIRSVAACTNR
jgi:hypothetical protein